MLTEEERKLLRAYTMNDAKKLLRAQYSNSKVTNVCVTRI